MEVIRINERMYTIPKIMLSHHTFLNWNKIIPIIFSHYRSGTLNSNTVNSKFHLIQSFFEIFARFLSFHV